MHSLFSRRQKPLVADVEFDAECGLWTVACERLGVFAEAPTYEELVKRFWELAPEMAAENRFPLTKDSRVEFRQISQLAQAN
jgi:hypothetical protein